MNDDDKELPSCGETKVYLAGMVLFCRCEHGVIVDTFVAGTPCPHHEENTA